MPGGELPPELYFYIPKICYVYDKSLDGLKEKVCKDESITKKDISKKSN
jgi:hypothetical protein